MVLTSKDNTMQLFLWHTLGLTPASDDSKETVMIIATDLDAANEAILRCKHRVDGMDGLPYKTIADIPGPQCTVFLKEGDTLMCVIPEMATIEARPRC